MGTGKKSSARKPTYVDQHVASRLRLRRVLLGLSQEELAKVLGLTSQQIQKYEAGETRISASRLYDLSGHLAVPITWFFEELEDEKSRGVSPMGEQGEQMNVTDLMAGREARQLVELYFGIEDEQLRRKVLEVAELLRRPAKN